jgi:TonB family protein
MAAAQTNGGDTAEALRAEGRANRDKIATRPSFVDGPRAVLPESEKALGHHGLVAIEGVIAADGRMHAARVKTSSGIAALDAIALAAAEASSFVPAKDSAGRALPVLTSMPFELVAYKSATGGVFEYRCNQFFRDMDWWRGANPDKSYPDHELYKLELGVGMLALIQPSRGDQDRLRKAIKGFEAKWSEAIERCRRAPEMLQKDALYR